jgi:RHS repeat-associated protein
MHNVGQIGTRLAVLGTDPAKGLHYYRARYYDPAAGRFLNEDPLQFNADVNFYRYVSNEPTNLADPFGLNPIAGTLPWWWIPGFGDAAGAAIVRVIGATGRVVGATTTAVLELTLLAPSMARDEDMLRDRDIAKDIATDKDTCPRANDPCKGLRDQVRDHLKKLRDFGVDPYTVDNKGFLGHGRDAEVIAGRVKNLLKQIRDLTKQLRDCEARNAK